MLNIKFAFQIHCENGLAVISYNVSENKTKVFKKIGAKMFKLDQKFQNRITANFGSPEFCDFFHLERKKVGNFNFAASSETSWNSFSSSKQPS